MSGDPTPPLPYDDLISAYADGEISEADLPRLEACLIESEEARKAFVEAFQFRTELHFAVRARHAADAAIEGMFTSKPALANFSSKYPSDRIWGRRLRWGLLTASIVLACLMAWAVVRKSAGRRASLPETAADGMPSARAAGGNIAWLVNAQDCQWAEAESEMPGRDMKSGKQLRLLRGLAEIEFDCGARVILQGPANLELKSGREALLHLGTLTARVPAQAHGFTVLSPRGKVVDLGTEFGLSVDDAGATTVRVFTGVVIAFPLLSGHDARPSVTLNQNQSITLDGRTVALEPSDSRENSVRFVRSIEPSPVVNPREFHLDFTRPSPGSILDVEGRGIGLTHRLPGTGEALPQRDPNLRLQTRLSVLNLTTTRSDINTQVGMPTGEYLGMRLSDLGFTGREDFEFSATISKIPSLDVVGQFGLYVGASRDANIRGGLISTPQPGRYKLFLVNNHGGRDSDLNEVGIINTGDDLRLTIRRANGRYCLVVENTTKGSSNTLAINHPSFLDKELDLFAGLFGANTQSDVCKTLTVSEVKITVWTTQPVPSGPSL
jgi:hypothetical protein